MESPNVFLPFVQYGFAGFCFILLAMIVWLVRIVLRQGHEMAKIVQQNNQVISALRSEINSQRLENSQLMSEMRTLMGRVIDVVKIVNRSER